MKIGYACTACEDGQHAKCYAQKGSKFYDPKTMCYCLSTDHEKTKRKLGGLKIVDDFVEKREKHETN